MRKVNKCLLFFVLYRTVSGLGETLTWKPKLDSLISHPMEQKWGMIRDNYGEPKFIPLQEPKLNRIKGVAAIIKAFSESPNSVTFYLYTRKNLNIAQQLYSRSKENIIQSTFDVTKPVKILVHGWTSSYQADHMQNMKDAFLSSEDVNVILMDWSVQSHYFYYYNAVATVPFVSSCLADFIDFLIELGVESTDIHAVGHSLGAQIVGLAGHSVKNGRLGRITGLDAALPGFSDKGPADRLDASDAEFVDCIHTCGGFLGIEEPLCTADFYPNGGIRTQPGCHWYELGGCSHSRSHELFTESIITEFKFEAYTCPDMAFDDAVSCKNDGALMGYPASSNLKGIFYLETNDEFPFSKSSA